MKLFNRLNDDSTQGTLPYEEVSPDGIMKLQNGIYNKSIIFEDTNYDLSHENDQEALFRKWKDFFNYFDSSIHVEMTYITKKTNIRGLEESISIRKRDDVLDEYRDEYNHILKRQFAKGNNGLTKLRMITYGISAETYKEARPKLERLTRDIIHNLKIMGVKAKDLSGQERLKILYELMNEGSEEEFKFDYVKAHSYGLTSKDYVAPSSFNFTNRKYFKMGNTLGAASYLQILAPELTDRVLKDFTDQDSSSVVSFHIESLDQTEAVKMVKNAKTELDKSKIDEQKKAVRAGYDMDVLPSDLVTFGEGAASLLEDLQKKNERLFLVTVVMIHTDASRKRLDNTIMQAKGIAQQHNCSLKRLDFEQEYGLISALPFGYDELKKERALTTSSLAVFVPFSTEELFDSGKEGLYYGINAVSNNMIRCDRKKLNVPNGLILGMPGYGKSFKAKQEMSNILYITDDDIIVSDPEGEYGPMIRNYGGQVVKISATSSDHINPMDINMNYSEDEDPVVLKSDFILSMCEQLIGGREGLKSEEKTIIDRAVREVYREYFENPVKMPILEDLYEAIKRQPEKEAGRLATSLELYVKGSLSMFNHETNVNLSNRLISFDIKDLGKQLKRIGMLIVQDQIWNRVTVNRAAKKTTWIYLDEFHLLLKDKETASFSVEIYKRFRKWGAIPTGITQNVKDLLQSSEIENIFENSDFICLLNQAPGDREILGAKLNMSKSQLEYISNVSPGEGIICYQGITVPFKDPFPKDTKMYKLMTTKPKESLT